MTACLCGNYGKKRKQNKLQLAILISSFRGGGVCHPSMGGTHRHRECAHPSSPILIFKCALHFPKEASMDGKHRHREGSHPSSPNCSNFQLCTAFPIRCIAVILGWQTLPPRRCPPTRPRINYLNTAMCNATSQRKVSGDRCLR